MNENRDFINDSESVKRRDLLGGGDLGAFDRKFLDTFRKIIPKLTFQDIEHIHKHSDLNRGPKAQHHHLGWAAGMAAPGSAVAEFKQKVLDFEDYVTDAINFGADATGVSTAAINVSLYRKAYVKSLTTATATTINFTNQMDGSEINLTLSVRNASGVVWTPTIKWAANTAPTLTTANKVHNFTFIYNAHLAAWIETGRTLDMV